MLIAMKPSYVTTMWSDYCQSFASYLLTLRPHLCYDPCHQYENSHST